MSRRKRLKRRKIQLISVVAILFLSLGLLGFLLISEMRADEELQTRREDSIRESEWEQLEETETNTEIPVESDIVLETEQSEVISDEVLLEEQVEQKLAQMTIPEKVAQLFMITPEALTGYTTVTAAGDVTRQALTDYPIGGLIFFAQNIVEPEQLLEMTGNLQQFADEVSGMPLFLGIDEEGGRVVRIAGNSNFDVPLVSDMRVIGDNKDADMAYEAGDTIGAYLNQYGLNLDFAPVADVLTNPDNQLLKNRSFGTDAALVSEMNQAFLRGLEEHQVYGCLKHFPGHGGTSGDTHEGYAYTERTLEELRKEELVPFQTAIQNDISFIMVAHIAAAHITGDNTPASLSSEVITGLLREEMQYEGIVITDAMNMGAITDEYNSSQAAVKAIQAGADLVLMPVDFKGAYQGVLQAVDSGMISEERIDESLRRILTVKLEMKTKK